MGEYDTLARDLVNRVAVQPYNHGGKIPRGALASQDELNTPIACSNRKRRSSTHCRSSRRRSATPMEHIATLEHKCRLNDPERSVYASRIAELEAEVFFEKQNSATLESSAKADIAELEKAVERHIEAAAKAAAEKAKAAAAGKKKKKEVIAMSLVMLEVKPLDDKTDLDKLAQNLFKNVTQDGLFWKTQYKKEPVAFGIFKLIVGFSCEDEKVSVDDIVEKIEAMDD